MYNVYTKMNWKSFHLKAIVKTCNVVHYFQCNDGTIFFAYLSEWIREKKVQLNVLIDKKTNK